MHSVVNLCHLFAAFHWSAALWHVQEAANDVTLQTRHCPNSVSHLPLAQHQKELQKSSCASPRWMHWRHCGHDHTLAFEEKGFAETSWSVSHSVLLAQGSDYLMKTGFA